MNDLTVIVSPHALADKAVLSLESPHSRRAYASSIARFLESGCNLSRDGVQTYLARLCAEKKGPVTRNTALAAIKLLAREANARGLLSDQDVYSIALVRGVSQKGERAGNWVKVEQIRQMLSAAQRSRQGTRDQAIIAVLFGCGLRRSEAASLVWTQYTIREGRSVILDIKGKGGRIRTVPVPEWSERYIDAWRAESTGESMFSLAPASIFRIVISVSRMCGITDFSPHDMRRTWSRLALDAGARIEQIQVVLGHSDIQTTMRYLGVKLELKKGKAATDLVEV